MTSLSNQHARLAQLEQSGAAFVTATVVTRRAPVSSHLGDQAIIHEGGRMEGFVGGACSREIIRKQALEVLATGKPRLVMIRPDPSQSAAHTDAFEAAQPDGETVVVPMTCASEGSVNVYLQPHLPARTLLVIGLTPVAEMLSRLGTAAGEQVRRVVTEAERQDVPGDDQVMLLGDLPQMLEALTPAQLTRLSAVVASQGHYDELALEALLRAGVGSVALLSSRKRAATVRELLQLQGLSAAQTGCIRAPAGLDLGATSPAEVAISILAELISLRQGRAVQTGMVQPGPVLQVESATAPLFRSESPRPGFAISVVDGEEIEISAALHFADHEGTRYYFSCPNCKRRFLKAPESYLKPVQPV